MARFVRAARNRGFDGEAAAMVESAIRHYADLKARAKRMISQRLELPHTFLRALYRESDIQREFDPAIED